MHKQTIEHYAALAYPNHYALRFGTVSGPSPKLRDDLLVNSLVLAAIHERKLNVANRTVNRPLLGIGDLCRAVEAILTRPVPPGCYNLASTNVQIGEVADFVAQRFHVPCTECIRENKYDIRVDTRKFTQAAGMEFHDDVPGLVEALYDFYMASPSWSSPRGI
jgi:nucleoside-diphosphate-sugar epimerase